jgi:hypothetical protein
MFAWESTHSKPLLQMKAQQLEAQRWVQVTTVREFCSTIPDNAILCHTREHLKQLQIGGGVNGLGLLITLLTSPGCQRSLLITCLCHMHV